jgi:hypothetical protein
MSVIQHGIKFISRGTGSIGQALGINSIGVVAAATSTTRSIAVEIARFINGISSIGVVTVSGTINIKQTEIDFGTTPVAEASFTIIDTDVSATSQLIGTVAYEAPTGKDLDELEMDGLDLKFGPGSGQFTLYARGLNDAYIADKFKINYLIG